MVGAVVIMFSITASTALGSIISTILCLGVVIDSQHRIRDDRIDSREHLIWRTRDRIVMSIATDIGRLWDKLWNRNSEESDEETRRLLG